MPTPLIRVASVPADHPYVRHLSAPGGDLVERLPDEREPGQRGWWPPRMLETGWVRENADDFDLSTASSASTGAPPNSCASWSPCWPISESRSSTRSTTSAT